MAWLWSKIHLRFASRQGRPAAEGGAGLPDGQLRRLHRRDGAADARRRRRGPHSAPASSGSRPRTTARPASCWPTARDVAADAVVAAVPSLLFKKMAPPLTPDYERQLDARAVAGRLCMVMTMKQLAVADLLDEHRRPHRCRSWRSSSTRTSSGPEHYGGNHILYISNYLRQDHEYFGMSEDELWAIFEPALKQINPAFSSDWVNERWLFKAPYAQPIIRTELQRRQAGPPHAGRGPVPGDDDADLPRGPRPELQHQDGRRSRADGGRDYAARRAAPPKDAVA